MAQAIMEQLAGGAVAAASAGSQPKPVHPNAIAVILLARINHAAGSAQEVR